MEFLEIRGGAAENNAIEPGLPRRVVVRINMEEWGNKAQSSLEEGRGESLSVNVGE